jgi:hypothetical protein
LLSDVRPLLKRPRANVSSTEELFKQGRGF